jgi:hypothetical protein
MVSVQFLVCPFYIFNAIYLHSKSKVARFDFVMLGPENFYNKLFLLSLAVSDDLFLTFYLLNFLNLKILIMEFSHMGHLEFSFRDLQYFQLEMENERCSFHTK